MAKSPEAFLEGLSDFGIKLGLDKTFFLLKKLGSPQKQYPSVLVAGTNGKGSVSSSLASILAAAGYRTGLYTSPHLVDVRERIALNGRMIPADRLAAEVRRLKRMLANLPYHLYPTYFEALTVLAFSYFAQEEAQVVVAEVGMGGRFDATNVLPAGLEIITPISLEHTQYLGKTIREIAGEKAGVIKEGSAVICAAQKRDALAVIRLKAADRKAELSVLGRDFSGRVRRRTSGGQTLDFTGIRALPGLVTPLLGSHQVENVSLAVQAALTLRSRGFSISERAIRRGLRATRWPARFQVLRKSPLLILDGAHNPAGIAVLQRTLAEVFPGRKFSYLAGVLKDKEWRTMLESLPPEAPLLLTRPENDRAVEPAELARHLERQGRKGPVRVVASTAAALQEIQQNRKTDFCICGSLYLAGDVLKCLGGKTAS